VVDTGIDEVDEMVGNVVGKVAANEVNGTAVSKGDEVNGTVVDGMVIESGICNDGNGNGNGTVVDGMVIEGGICDDGIYGDIGDDDDL
jgi:hypothetical protein